jgi:Uma2 family endonuclease
MATAPPLLSIEEYLRTSYRPDADYVNGEIEERNLGEYEHARLQYLLAAYFVTREKLWAIKGVVEQRIRINSSRVRVADFAILRADAPREKVTETPPLICIEIMSPEDRLSRAEQVLADYFAMGVANIWLIDPLRRAAFTFTANGLQKSDALELTTQDGQIRLSVGELFENLD